MDVSVNPMQLLCSAVIRWCSTIKCSTEIQKYINTAVHQYTSTAAAPDQSQSVVTETKEATTERGGF